MNSLLNYYSNYYYYCWHWLVGWSKFPQLKTIESFQTTKTASFRSSLASLLSSSSFPLSFVSLSSTKSSIMLKFLLKFLIITLIINNNFLLLTTTTFFVDAQRVLKVSQQPPLLPPSSSSPPSSSPPSSSQIISDEFSPLVTARCDRGIMFITIVTQQPFYGIAHTRDFRRSPCMVVGNGSYNTTLKISLLAQQEDELYCGVQRFKGERSISLAVRMHRSLELSEDRFFYLTCQSGYQNIKGGTYRVNLKLIDINSGQRAVRLIHGEPYKLRAELSPHDSITTLRIKNCFVFTKQSNVDNVELIDRSGCPTINGLITEFYYNDSFVGEALIPEMFKFPQETKVHFQCDALLCRDNCDEPDCDGKLKNRELELDGYSQVSASTSAFIREPSDLDALTDANQNDMECTEWRFPWLITLCICLAIMLLTMLLLNLFMCSSLTCRCIKTEANEKDPTEFDDYDPYRADWTAPNSLHGSRYSLDRARQQQQQQQNLHHHPQYHSQETLRSDQTSNPDYYHHDDDDNDNLHQRRSRRHIQPATSESESEDIDEPSYRSARGPSQQQQYHPSYPSHHNNGSLRPIRPKEVDYYYDQTEVKRY